MSATTTAAIPMAGVTIAATTTAPAHCIPNAATPTLATCAPVATTTAAATSTAAAALLAATAGMHSRTCFNACAEASDTTDTTAAGGHNSIAAAAAAAVAAAAAAVAANVLVTGAPAAGGTDGAAAASAVIASTDRLGTQVYTPGTASGDAAGGSENATMIDWKEVQSMYSLLDVSKQRVDLQKLRLVYKAVKDFAAGPLFSGLGGRAQKKAQDLYDKLQERWEDELAAGKADVAAAAAAPAPAPA